MKRNYFIFPVYMFIILITTISSGYSGTLNRSDYQKLDPQLAALIEHPDMASLIFHQAVGKRTSFPSRLNVIIKTSLSRAELNQYRVIVHCKIGQITTASIFPDELPSLVQNPDIYFIKLPRKVSVLNDVSIPAIRVPEIWNQYGLKGRCVIIGIIDTGIDWRHEDFRNSDGTTRIKALLDFSDPGDTNGDEILDGTGPFGGSLYLEDQINQAISGGGEVSEKDLVGHGTHVAGSAAGNGRATGNGISSNTYVGVAPEADLIIVKAARDKGSRNFYDFDYINAIKFIDSMSTVLREPYVINLSLGGSNGPHDGRDLAEQAIDELVGRNKRGKAIVISAGNDGEKAIHSTGTFTNYNNSYEIRFSIPNYNPNSDNMDDYVFFEGWYSASDIYKIKIITPTNKIFGPVTTGNEYGTDTNEGAIYITNAKNGTSPLNGDRQFLVQVYDFTKQNTPASGEWKIIIEGTSGRYDLWLSASTMDAYLASQADNLMIVGTPGTAFNAITVGSYVTKVRWIDYDNNDLYIPNLELEYASAFSSPGPTRDGRIKPEISAPGEMIAASLSADAFPGSSYSMFETGSNQFPNGYVARDGKHGISKGTSFSAPHVTGTVALLFSYNPNLDAIDVRNAIINSAKKDGFTGSTPNDKWGYGKLDAYNAIKYIINNPPEITLNLAIFQNPALTQYIDFYLISKHPLQQLPTATIKIGNQSPESINMSQLDSYLYKGEFVLTQEGLATLTVNATIQGQSAQIIYKYFNVNLLKMNSENNIHYDYIDVFIPKNAIQSDMYLTISPETDPMPCDNLKMIYRIYKIGPDQFMFKKPVQLSFSYLDEMISEYDEAKLAIYQLIDENWKKLPTTINAAKNLASTTVTQSGAFGLFYDPANQSTNLPDDYTLFQNYPNPFNSSTTISYYLPNESRVTITIYNIKGEIIATLISEEQKAGYHRMIWEGKNDKKLPVTSGIYVYRLSTNDNFSQTKKMIIIK